MVEYFNASPWSTGDTLTDSHCVAEHAPCAWRPDSTEPDGRKVILFSSRDNAKQFAVAANCALALERVVRTHDNGHLFIAPDKSIGLIAQVRAALEAMRNTT